MPIELSDYQIRKIPRLIVPYNIELRELIESHNFRWIDLDVTPECFTKGKESVTRHAALITFNRIIESDSEIDQLMASLGLQPADPYATIVFAAWYPKDTLVGLGSGSPENPAACVAFRYLRERRISILERKGPWNTGFTFLGLSEFPLPFSN